MNCHKCGYPNLPGSLDCGYCGHELQTPEEADKQKEVWGRLPPETVTGFKNRYTTEQARFHRIIKYLHKVRLFHIVLGAVLLSGVGLWAATFWIMDIFCGAIAGWLINEYKGGLIEGSSIMLGAYLISFMTKLSLRGGNPILAFAGILGTVSSLVIGLLFGLYVERDLERHIQ